jgi:hypothetical protein
MKINFQEIAREILPGMIQFDRIGISRQLPATPGNHYAT